MFQDAENFIKISPEESCSEHLHALVGIIRLEPKSTRGEYQYRIAQTHEDAHPRVKVNGGGQTFIILHFYLFGGNAVADELLSSKVIITFSLSSICFSGGDTSSQSFTDNIMSCIFTS